MFDVMKLSHYVIVDDSSNYVKFHKLNVHIKIKKNITPHNKRLGRLCSSAIGSSNTQPHSTEFLLKPTHLA